MSFFDKMNRKKVRKVGEAERVCSTIYLTGRKVRDKQGQGIQGSACCSTREKNKVITSIWVHINMNLLLRPFPQVTSGPFFSGYGASKVKLL